MNVGEEICGEWLRHMKDCDFVQYNIQTNDSQGEIDVVGINLRERLVYTCEVAVHLVTGLRYSKNSRPDTVSRLTTKFRKDIKYIQSAFPEYKQHFMLWSPVVKNEKDGSKYSGLRDIHDIIAAVQREHKITIEAVVNHEFMDALNDLREAARKETKALDSPVMRYLQIEEHLKKHLCRLDARQADPDK
jgi:hypothetical protein